MVPARAWSKSVARGGIEASGHPAGSPGAFFVARTQRRGARMLYPHWLNPGDNSWQMTAATLVGLMSVPGLVVLYGGVMQKRWSVNSMMLAFTAFAAVLIVWVLYAFDMGFGNPWHGLSHNTSSFWGSFIGQPGAVLNHTAEQGIANIPLVGGPA